MLSGSGITMSSGLGTYESSSSRLSISGMLLAFSSVSALSSSKSGGSLTPITSPSITQPKKLKETDSELVLILLASCQ